MAAHTKKYIGAISYSQDTIAVTNSENIVASGVEPRVGKRRVGGAGRGRVVGGGELVWEEDNPPSERK